MDQWLSTFQNGSKAEYNLALVFRWLCMARAVYPCSKKKTIDQVIPSLFDAPIITYDQVLSSLEILGNIYEKVVEHSICYEEI